MKPTRNSFLASTLSNGRLATVATFAISLCASHFVSAGSQTWAGTTDATWVTGTNWVGLAAPGNTTPASNNDIATFNSALNGTIGGSTNPVVIDSGTGIRTIGGITFDTASAGSYQIGTTAGLQLGFTALTAGTNLTQVTANVATPQVIASPIYLRNGSGSANPSYTFKNNATNTAATLSFTGLITANGSSSRPTFLTLDGSNTGSNIISGNLNNPASAQGGALLTKNGVGTWILAGTNVFSSSSATSIEVNAGVLSLQNNLALGNTANNTVNINNTGTLQLANGITLDNAKTLALKSGGTIRSSNGSNTTNSVISVSAVAATSATISTVGSGDTFTIGNAANDFTGGASDTVVHVSGPGTVVLGQSSNYLGTVSVDSGTLKIGNANALLSAAVAFGPSSNGVFQLNGINGNVTSLASDVTVGTPVVENNSTTTAATLTVNKASSTSTYGGVLQNGTAVGTNTLALTKAGAGTLTLSGNSNTYTGGTTISGGVLLLTNTSGSATGTGAVALNSGSLSGTGIATGEVTVASAASIAPGNGGIGALTVGGLTLSSGSKLDYDITSTVNMDQITANGVLTINGGQLNINGGTAAFTANGVYNLIGGYTSIAGTGISALTLNALNQDIVNKTYTFGQSGGFVTLTVATSTAVLSYWNSDANGNWSTGPWTTVVPNSVGSFASFGGGGTAITAPRAVSVDGSYTVGTLGFNNATQSFTLAAGSGAQITLDNGASGSFVSDTAGSHLVEAPIALTTNGATFSVVGGGDILTASGVVSGSGALTKAGNGTLALSGTNTYTGNTVINAGTVAINSMDSLGDLAFSTTISAATLRATADIATTRSFNITDAASAISVDAGKTYSISGVIGAGAGTLNKSGTGTLALSGANTYSGGTVVSSGTLNVSSDAALGAIPGVPAANLALNNGTTLQAGGNLTLNANRNLVFNSGTEVIDTQASTMVLAGGSNGSGAVTKTGSGNLTVAAGQGYSGGTTVNGGTLQINQGGGLTGGIAFGNGTTFRMQHIGSNSVFLGNAVSIAPGATTTFVSSSTANGYSGNLSSADGTSVISITGGANNFNFSASNVKQFAGFLGTVNVVAGSTMDSRGTTNNNGGDNTTFQIDGGVTSKNGGNWAFGALTGASTGNLGGVITYTVGAKGVNSTYSGNITTSATTGLIKTGSAKLTLAGTTTYTGNTVVNAGTFALADNAQLTFKVGASGTNNSISGTGTVNLAGDFNLDLSNPAALVTGSTWTLVNVGTLTGPIFEPTFNIPGFTEVSDVWTKVDGGNTWTFTEATGQLSLTITGYSSWTSTPAFGLTAGVNDGPTQDPDFDGISNLLEYVLNGNPSTSDSSILPQLVVTGSAFEFTYSRLDLSKSDTTQTFEYGSDLTGWTPIVIPTAVGSSTVGIATVTVTDSGTTDTVKVSIPTSAAVGGKLFGHLKAVK